ncbi:peptidyl-prolyl cis-trans isomerase [Alicyclobacillus dauci]|uniref:peptidylprolyl isomerase n=1 Tax=Alicyclobacillus dauci TaxID=1475485 RepID=A0ABY6Z0L0_9BACL|nr:peptidyl-prolyl cis-trans isomerase [Alicyclobacillus dauci]WAH36402.1 peptidyl-prolyl cis-trans isomerase [Alicyclobacillus dauci]
MASIKQFVSPVVGALVGAVIVGGVWYGVHASTSSSHQIVAKVGSTPITHQDLVNETEAYAGTQMLSQLITNQLILDAAKSQNVSASDTEVNQSLQSLEQQNGISSDAQLQDMLKQSHMTKAELMNQLKVQVLEQKLAESKVTVTDQQIQDFYNKNKQSLASPETRSISDIIVSSQGQAKQIQQQLSQGKKFSDLAKQSSTDSATKDKGGAMGTFSQAELSQQAPDIASAAFKLKKGDVSSPIKVASGYELVQVTAITPAKVPTLAEAKSNIVSALKQQNAPAPQQLVADLMKKDNVQIIDTSYASVKQQLANPAPQTGLPTGGQ